MKKIILIFTFIFSIVAHGQQLMNNTPDIVVMTELNRTWGQYLLDTVSRFLVQNDIFHFQHMEFDQTINVVEVETKSVLPPRTSEFLKELETYIQDNPVLADAPLSVDIEHLELITAPFIPEFEIHKDYEGINVDRGIVLKGEIETEQLTVKAKKLNIRIKPEIMPGRFVDIILTLKNPSVSLFNPCVDPEQKSSRCEGDRERAGEGRIAFETIFKTEPKDGNLNIEFIDSRFDSIQEFVRENPELVQIDDFELETSGDISLSIGSYQWTLNVEFLESFLNENKRLIRDLMLEQMIRLLSEGKGHELLELIGEQNFRDHNEVDASGTKALMTLSEMGNRGNPKYIVLNIENDFCTGSNYEEFNWRCILNKVTKNVEEAPIDETYERSMERMTQRLDSKEVNFIASISEDFVNKLIHALYDDGYFESITHEMRGKRKNKKWEQVLSLGEKGVQVKFDKETKTGWAWIDVQYKLKKFHKKILGMDSDILRIPVGIELSTRIENNPKTNIPDLVLRLESFDYNKDNFRKGVEEYGLESNFRDANFLRMFIRPIIKKMLKPYFEDEKQREIKIPMQEIQGLGLEKLDMYSDGLGRMVLELKLEESSFRDRPYLISQPVQ